MVEQIIFDFDGVIVDSVGLKTEAFASVYHGEAPDLVAAAVEYQDVQGGVGRREKFAYLERTLFGRSGDAQSVDRLCARFAAAIDEGMQRVGFVPGAKAFLEACLGRVRMHLVSGTPEEELRRIVAERDLAHFFEQVIGSPTRKADAFRAILEDTGIAPERSLAIGDSLTEFEAATDTRIPFLAIVARGRQNRFPDYVPAIEDLTSAAAHVGLAMET